MAPKAVPTFEKDASPPIIKHHRVECQDVTPPPTDPDEAVANDETCESHFYDNNDSAPKLGFSSFGTMHPTLQRYDCCASSVEDLLESVLPAANNPTAGWRRGSDQKEKSDGKNVLSWFPKDDGVAFYIPSPMKDDGCQIGDGESCGRTTVGTWKSPIQSPPLYRALSYASLKQLLGSLTPFPCSNIDVKKEKKKNERDNEFQKTNKGVFVVAVLLPSCLMFDTALAILAIISNDKACAAPLEPEMSPPSVCDAMEQMECRALVTTAELWEKMLPTFKERRLYNKLEDVRLVPEHGVVYEDDFWTPVALTIQSEEPLHRHEGPLSSFSGNDSDRPKLLLRTSGTTSKPKVVPISGPALLYNAICLSAGLGLTRFDVKLNVLPFYHIGGFNSLLAVLVTGSGIIMNGPFDPDDFIQRLMPPIHTSIVPTWYSGNPTINQALVLAIQKHLRNTGDTILPNKLRFVRSGAAHLSHETALELSRLLHIPVLPAYGMSECRPICLSSKNPIVWTSPQSQDLDNLLVDTVGIPIGPSVRIIDDNDGSTLPHDTDKVGEVCVGGPGVIKWYIGVGTEETHTPDGWLRTGDYGRIDVDGQLFLKGRKKELIKRGGEQVWPNEIDDVVESVDGVIKAVAFGVKNDLWGEEVAVAAVLEKVPTTPEDEKQVIRSNIVDACRRDLKPAAVPVQVILLSSTDELPRGPTGKYLRNNVASHLNVTAVDHLVHNSLLFDKRVERVDCPDDDDGSEGFGNEADNATEGKVQVPEALNGLRFLAACFVLQKHVGTYPNGGWEMVTQFYQAPAIFLALGVLQNTVGAESDILKHWVVFVGNKIGTMHALFIVTQIIALGSYLLLQCGSYGYQEIVEGKSCSEGEFLRETIGNFIGTTILTPFFPFNVVNYYAWFQATFYSFLILFPLVHSTFHKLSVKWQNVSLVFALLLTGGIGPILYACGVWYELDQTIIAWLPLLVATMFLAYRFVRISPVKENRYAGYVADGFSILLLALAIISAVFPGCVMAPVLLYEQLKQDEELPPTEFTLDGEDYVHVCGVSYEDFKEIEDQVYGGRYMTMSSFMMSELRIASPVILGWLYFLSYGRGLTVRLFSSKPFLLASPWAYHLYLLQLPMLRFYWVVTRGLDHERWSPANVNAPIKWYELPIIIVMSVLIGVLVQRTLVGVIMPYSTNLGVRVCSLFEKMYRRFWPSTGSNVSVLTNVDHKTTSKLVIDLLSTLTGTTVTTTTNLKNVGLHSLGASALLSVIKSSIPNAKNLKMAQLGKLETVCELVEYLDSLQNSPSVGIPFGGTSTPTASRFSQSSSTGSADITV